MCRIRSKNGASWISPSIGIHTFFHYLTLVLILSLIWTYHHYYYREYIVTSSKDNTCRVWNVNEKLCCGIGEGHIDSVGAVSMSKFIASYKSKQVFMVSGGSDKILKRWDLPLHTMKTSKVTKLTPSHSVRAHEKGKNTTIKNVIKNTTNNNFNILDVNAVTVSPNDTIIASGSQDKSIRLWRSTDLTAIATLTGHKRGIWRLVFSPIDKTLASSSGDRTVRLWSMSDHTCLRTFEGHTASVLCVRFINNGTQLLSGSADGLIRLWTIRTGECENTFDEHQDKVWTICSNPNDDSTFFSGGSDSKFIIWKDFTEQTENDRLKAEEDNLLLEQQMNNDIRNKRYGEVFLLLFICIIINIDNFTIITVKMSNKHYNSLDTTNN